MLRKIARKIDRAQDAWGRGLAWVMLLMVLVVFGDVVMRYTLNRTFVFTQEFEWYLFAITYLMAGGYVTLRDEHIRVDILHSRRSPRAKAWYDLVLFLLFYFPACALVMVTTWPFFRNSLSVWEGSPDPGGIPARWALKGVIILAFVFMAVQGFSEVVKRFYVAMGWEESDAHVKEVH
jgi:TRAP-type mannitol/chloroaromatic compound transport system permease small subunit